MKKGNHSKTTYVWFATILVFISIASVSFVLKYGEEPWKEHQLMKPEELVKLLSDSDKKNDPLIFNIGPAGSIKGAVEIGPVDEGKGLKMLEAKIKNLSKDKSIVIYCGCCPFAPCPNIRPAFSLLNKKGFSSHKLLYLPNNLKADWIDKGLPMAED